MSIITKVGIGGLLIPISFQFYLIYLHRGLPFQKKSTSEKYFSNDYYEARDKFRRGVVGVGMELHSLKLNNDNNDDNDDEKEDLTIDIGVLKRSERKVLIHVSGTHGVEGFAGSAIQSALLENSNSFMNLKKDGDDIDNNNNNNNNKNNNDEKNNQELPTVVFVHGLNPYGFSNFRRFNENNVDLNRNFLTPQSFNEMKKSDPNHSGYVDNIELINPTQSFDTKWDFFYFHAIRTILKNGYTNVKQGLVSGNYHYPKTLFYGGQELQPSYVLLKQFLLDELDIQRMEVIGLIDVHTGLGPSGFDSISLQTKGEVRLDEAETIFGGTDNKYKIHLSGFESTSTSADDLYTDTVADASFSGYDKAVGFLGTGLMEQVFPSKARVIPIFQEFGTIPGILVFKALRAENAMYHYDPANRRPKYAQDVCDAFYLKDNPSWKDKVASRGQEVFNQLYSHLVTLE
jgi:hypothetical protein